MPNSPSMTTLTSTSPATTSSTRAATTRLSNELISRLEPHLDWNHHKIAKLELLWIMNPILALFCNMANHIAIYKECDIFSYSTWDIWGGLPLSTFPKNLKEGFSSLILTQTQTISHTQRHLAQAPRPPITLCS